MGSVYVPRIVADSLQVGYLDPALFIDPILVVLKGDGKLYSNGWKIEYGGGSFAYYYPAWDSSTGNVYINRYAMAYTVAIPIDTWSAGVKVYIIGN